MPLSPFWIWLIVGVILFVMELILPTAFMEATAGLSALIVAFLSPLIPSFSAQIVLWIGLSVAVVFLLRRYQPKRVPPVLRETAEGETLTKIPAGETGRVLYEGISWQARCHDPRLAIPEHQRVIIVGRQGTTLIVMPEDVIQY
ncbi:MAG: NfeD family protein [Thermosynechococcus sp. Uc]|uniref:NfeD family protein n=1 Tax=Thermosynechococcus sp. Uc TaxID=3034853 RepID=UPI00259FD2D0|nr:NfeD family protein [Thermosynechococcus sp. Uc]MDM7325670.1 NfeD family protein [Thermosynechococcus sp. Uc]